MPMAHVQSVDDFKNRIDHYLDPVFRAKAQLDEFDEQVAQKTEENDQASHELQKAISTVIKEKVFTKEFLASKGYKQAVGRQAVKVDVEEINVPFSEIGNYINNTFQNLQNLKEHVESTGHNVESLQDTRSALYREYADTVHAALESKAVSRPQLTSFGFSIPAKSATTKAQQENENHDAEEEQSQ